jgi:hypothetical protein
MALLVMKTGDLAGKAYRLNMGQRVILGRTQGATLILPDTKLSRRHCVIEGWPQTGKYTVMDLGSLNGTIVNGEKVTEKILASGDLISIGTTEMEFRLQSSDQAQAGGGDAAVGRAKIADVKQAAMGKAEGETFLSAKHKFCEACGAETSPADVEAGRAKVLKNVFLCARCAAEFAKLDAEGKGTLAELMGVLRRLEAEAKQAGDPTERVDGDAGTTHPGDTVMGAEPVD